MFYLVHQSNFGVGFFLLLLTSIVAILSVVARFHNTEFPTRAVKAFQLYFFAGGLSFAVVSICYFIQTPIPMKMIYAAHVIVSAILLVLWRRVVRVKHFWRYLVPALVVLLAINAFSHTPEQILWQAIVFNIVFFSVIAFAYSNSVLIDRNSGDWIILLALLGLVLSNMIQGLILNASGDIALVANISFVSQCVYFVMLGIGFLSSLLLNEHETQFALAQTDALTGALNRRGLEHRLSHAPFVTDDREQDMSVIAMDIDKFKSINDQYGHEIGDKVLSTFANIVSAMSRPSDIFARIGGEEFVLVLSGTNKEDANLIAERIRQTVSTFVIQTVDGEFSITCSFGISSQSPYKGDLYLLMKYADKALYEAKYNGRNRVESFDAVA